MIEKIHREDLSMLEKASAAYTIFEKHGIDTPAKKLSSSLGTLHIKIGKKEKLTNADLVNLKICKKIGREPYTIRTWLKLISVDSEIQTIEISKPKNERLDSKILAKLTTMQKFMN